MRGAERFVHANTAVAAAPLVPEIRLHLATEVTPLWQATESELARKGLEPPFWAFAWPGGQALARHVLDHPELVQGRRVLDIAAGSGIAAIAAARAGAAQVVANEIDEFAAAALALNARINRAAVEISRRDLLGGGSDGFDLILAGDVCYERPMSDRMVPWLRARAAEGALVLLGDPGRAYLPSAGLVALARYDVPTTLELEDRTLRQTVVWRVEPDSCRPKS
jgi:predicted nicotinamide N-methyase